MAPPTEIGRFALSLRYSLEEDGSIWDCWCGGCEGCNPHPQSTESEDLAHLGNFRRELNWIDFDSIKSDDSPLLPQPQSPNGYYHFTGGRGRRGRSSRRGPVVASSPAADYSPAYVRVADILRL